MLKLMGGGVVVLLMIYLLLPAPGWPGGLPEAVQSEEPGDRADLNSERAYFTNWSRAEVLEYYTKEFSWSGWGMPLPTYRLNYPPEEAQTIIREQTRSSYLEEIVHPLRESFYVNGYEPKESEDKISVDGQPYTSKVTVRYVRSNVAVRAGVFGVALVAGWWLGREIVALISNFKSQMSKPDLKSKK